MGGSDEVIHDQIELSVLRSGLETGQFEVLKTYAWIKMIHRGMLPRRWVTTETGTTVTYDTITDEDEFDIELDLIRNVLDEIEETYLLDMQFVNRQESSS